MELVPDHSKTNLAHRPVEIQLAYVEAVVLAVSVLVERNVSGDTGKLHLDYHYQHLLQLLFECLFNA